MTSVLHDEIKQSLIRDLLLELNAPEKVEDFLSGFFYRENYTAIDVITVFNNLCKSVDIPEVQDHLNTVIKRNCFDPKPVLR
jgi:hypothetical protein